MINSSVKAFFDVHGPELESFGVRHGLLLEKYWHDSSSWRFSFQHPNGGIGCVEIVADPDAVASINCYCWIDDYQEGRRNLRREVVDDVPIDSIFTMLDDCYRNLVGWSIESLGESAEGFKEMWQRSRTQEEFYALNDRYPTPTTQ